MISDIRANSRTSLLTGFGDLERALNRHPAVHEAVVLSRRDVLGSDRTVAYVVPADIRSMETLPADLRNQLPAQQLPDGYVFLTSIPLGDSGSVATDELEQYEVIDGDLIDQWAKSLGKIDNVLQVEVVPLGVRHHAGCIHRLDLLPDGIFRRGRKPTAPQNERKTANDAFKKSGLAVSAIVHGASLTLPEDSPGTLGESLRRAAERYGDRGVTYVRADGSEHFHSYPQLLAEAEKVLAGLSDLGLEPGDKVIFQLHDNHEFLAAFWGCVLGGMIPVPISIAPNYVPSSAIVQKLANAWRMLEQPLILASQALVPHLRSVLGMVGAGGARIQSVNELSGGATPPLPGVQPDDLALLLLTSGSTGTPKAVMHSHRTLLNRSASTAAFNQFCSEDVSMNWMPLDHVGGIVMFHLRDVFTGCMQVQVATGWILENPLRWMDLIERHKATVTWAPNFAYALVADRAEEIARRRWDLSSMRFMLNGGEAVVARTARRFLRLLAPHGLPENSMHPAWGMSETASGITYSHHFSLQTTGDDVSAVEVGEPIPNTSLRIVDANNQVVSEGEKGDLQVRGASIMLGYYQNPEMNRKVFTQDGWFDTGDVGFLREGRLTVTARTKDDIIINGINYLASEIEAVTDGVDGVAVSYSAACAVRRPESDTDELAIFFSPSSGTDDELSGTLRSIRKHVATNVGISPACLIPLSTDQIPKTAIGKIQRSELRRRFEAGEFDAVLKRADLLTDTNTIPEWFYRKVWRNKEPSSQLALTELGPSLVFVDALGLGDALCSELRRLEQRCVAVEVGSDFVQLDRNRYRIDPKNRDHYSRLMHALREDDLQVGQIVHLWTFEEGTAPVSVMEELVEAQHQGAYSVLFLTQALAEMHGEPRSLNLHVVSRGAQVTSSADECSCKHSAIIGLLKTIPHELSWLHCRHIDLDAASEEANVKHVLDELRLVAADDEVAYRNGRRLVWRLGPVDLRKQEPAQLPIRSGGIYLITGGLGGIGSYLATVLMRAYQAKLILVGTTRLPERTEWPACLERGGRLANRIHQCLEIESLGGEFVYASADVSDLARLNEIVAAAETRWNDKLAGIFHLAAGGDVGSHWQDGERHHVSSATTESFDLMFRSKVYGSWALYQIVKKRPDAIMVSFGSVLGIFGAARFGAYAAAHTFLRNFTLNQHYHHHPRSYSFSWTVWSEMGMSKADPASAKDLYRALGYFLIPKELGLDSLIGGLWRDLPDLIVGLDAGNMSVRKHLEADARPLQKLAAYFTTRNGVNPAESGWTELRVQDRFGTPSQCELTRLEAMPLTREGQVDRGALRMMKEEKGAADDQGGVQPRTEVEKRIADIWRDVLAIHRPGIHDSFFHLGGNSLTATQVLSRVRQAFQVRLDMRDLFERATVSELAALVEERQDQRGPDIESDTIESLDPETLLANVAQMSDAKVAELLKRMQGEEERR
jgi:acyl-CoA synthetase (AMP-forming)/AMP-acid ligase II/NAD(P)-dependent dehydrogenase (short-subunit alcohol dehydrogenase family)/acyl carrier protein